MPLYAVSCAASTKILIPLFEAEKKYGILIKVAFGGDLVKKTILALVLILSMLLFSIPALAVKNGDLNTSTQANLERIGYSAAWEQGFNGRGVRIAVIDSGLYDQHEDLAGANILQGVNVIDRSTKTNDTSGHGTFISAMLVAGRDNGIGISGMVDKASLVPLKCFSSGRQTDVRYIVSAIYMAVDEYNCDVINLSLGIVDDIPALKQAVDYAAEQGVIIVASAGNTGGTAMVYPASYSSVVAVGSVSAKDTSSYFSQRNSSVFVVAPGEDIVSAGISAPDAYMEGSGTSFSSVHVTALAAIAKQHNHSIDSTQFQQLLRDSAEDLGEPGYDTTFGWGIVNTPAFIELLLQCDTGFTDITGHWAEEYILKCTDVNLFSGMSEELFVPDGKMTRAMAASVLYRLAGEPMITADSVFSDVPEEKWYSAPIAWAAQNGLVTGFDGHFLPEQNITRQELAAMFSRYASWVGLDTTSSSVLEFTDTVKVADWAQAAVSWCCKEGLVSGRPDGSFDPLSNASRAEVAAMLVRFMEAHGL